MKALVLDAEAPEHTQKLGRRLGHALRVGDVIALVGPLGAGKTLFVKGLAQGLGLDPATPVTSPTYVILHEYPGPTPCYHFDFYRLGSEDDVIGIGYEEYFDGDGVCAVEWADKFESLFGPATLWIEFEVTGERSRRIGFRPGSGLADHWAEIESALEGT